MPKNKGKGGKNRRRGKNESLVKRELQEKGEGQEYGQVLRMLGNGRVECYCFDGKKRLCHIRGKMRKKQWVNQGDIVLIGKREFQDDKGDIILRYNADEARQLKKKGALPNNIQIEEREHEPEDDVPFDFTGADDSGDSSDSREIMTQPSNRGMLPPSDSEDEESEEVDLDEL